MRNITVLFEKEKIIPNDYKTITFETSFIRTELKITHCREYFESIIIEEKDLELITDKTLTGELNYTFLNTGIHNVLVKFKPEIIDFTNCFNSVFLKTISENLFINNPKAISFNSCFQESGLTSIPENLFANNPKVESFSSCFNTCLYLTSIPKGLFNNNKKVQDFSYCFLRGDNVRGETPSDENGIKLWERTSENGYIDGITGTQCFIDCFNLSDKSEIPDNWK